MQPYKEKINRELSKEYEIYLEDNIYPPKEFIFRCFNYFNINETRAIILGQDPYQNKGYADGLSFSISGSNKTPKSLNNIFKELERSYGIKRTKNSLEDWAEQGVLLLNTSLTVIDNNSGSHIKIWKEFINSILEWIGNNVKDICIMLWGNHAISYSNLFTNQLILTHTHPSPLSRKPFMGNNHFIECNKYCKKMIKWLFNR